MFRHLFIIWGNDDYEFMMPHCFTNGGLFFLTVLFPKFDKKIHLFNHFMLTDNIHWATNRKSFGGCRNMGSVLIDVI